MLMGPQNINWKYEEQWLKVITNALNDIDRLEKMNIKKED
jgi:hypothetical protein